MRKVSAQGAPSAGANVVLRLAAIIAGAIMTLVGIGMGVTIALLPVGVPLGLVGAGVFTWGVFGCRRRL